MRWLFGGGEDGHGTLEDWTPARAARAAEATERLLLGACGPAVVEDAASRRRAQFWRDVEARQERPRAALRRVR